MANIVIIDDSATVLKYMKQALQPLGHIVVTFHNPLEAIEVIPSLFPHLIIVDYVMFDMDGIDVIIKLRELGLQSKFVLFSALINEFLHERCFKHKITLIDKENKDELIRWIQCL